MQEKETKTTIEFEVKVKTFDMTKGELIDAIAAGSKLTKADAGRELENANASIVEDTVEISFDPCLERINSGCGCPKITMRSHTKMTKADSGKTE
jgi:hypothetical protein